MLYECHITCRRSDLAHTTAVAGELHWKTSQIERDPVLGNDTFCYLTSYEEDMLRMHERMLAACARLRELGATVIREKIELIVYDKRHVKTTGRLYESYATNT